MSKLILVILASILVLCIRFYSYYSHQKLYQDGQMVNLQVVLYEEPEFSIRGQSFQVKNSQNQRIYINTNLNKLYHYGDKLAISGTLQVRKNDKGAVFYRLNYPQIILQSKARNPLFEASLFIREKSSSLFQATLPKTSGSLLLGIVYGAKGDFADDFFQQLRSTGVLHVIAASGMNVSFFTGAVLFSLGAIFSRRLSLFLSIFVVVFYSFLVGFEPSILRASIMAGIAITASFFGRQNLALFGLGVTGFVMLFWQPNYLFDVGFQLSFMATLGILLIKPALEQIKRLRFFQILREDLFTTLAAQIATFPILLGTFGNIGVLSLLVNLLVLWTVPILMVLGSLAILCGLIFAPIGKLVLFLALPFLVYFEKVVSLFGQLGWMIQMDTLPWEMIVGYYFLLTGIVLHLGKKEQAG